MVGADGTIFIGSSTGLSAVRPDGSPIWQLPIGSIAGLALADDGTIYAPTSGRLRALRPDGSLKWELALPTANLFGYPVIDADGRIYIFGSGDLKAISPAGTVAWTYDSGFEAGSSAGLGPDGTIYFNPWTENSTGELVALRPTGTEKWAKFTRRSSGPAIATDGTVYVGPLRERTLYAIRPNGSTSWTYTFPGSSYTAHAPAIASDGTVYSGGPADRTLYALRPTGSSKWTVVLGGTVNSPLIVGSDGTVYVGASDRKIYAVRPDGSVRWEFDTGRTSPAVVAMGADGTLFVQAGGALLAIGEANLEPCSTTASNACLLGGRFRVNVGYMTQDSSGFGQVMSFAGSRAESDQSAFFYFFDNAKFEMGVKMVNACSLNDSVWVFISGLTNQAYAVSIVDTLTGQTRFFTNPLGTYPQSIGVTDGVAGFDCTPGSSANPETPNDDQVRAVLAAAPFDPLGNLLLNELTPVSPLAASTCAADGDTACHLSGRFKVEVTWTTVSNSGSAKVMSFGGERASSDQSSFWWFFDPANFEMGVKMVDACSPPFNAYWVFVSGLTNQGFTVIVQDTTTGLTKLYANPLGQYPRTIGATTSVYGFPCVQ